MDFEVDYPLFLAVTNRKPGDQGVWTFDHRGIRSTIGQGGGSAHQALLTHRIVEGSRIDFPCGALDLRRVEENLGEGLTPGWFREVVESATLVRARDILYQAKEEAKRNYEKAQRLEAAAKTGTFESRGEKVRQIAWATQVSNEAMLGLFGIEKVEQRVGSTPTSYKDGPSEVFNSRVNTTWQKIPMLQGSKPIRVLLIDALNGLQVMPQDATTGDVINWLLENRSHSVRAKQRLPSQKPRVSTSTFGTGPSSSLEPAQDGQIADSDPPLVVQYRSGEKWEALTSTSVTKALDTLEQALKDRDARS